MSPRATFTDISAILWLSAAKDVFFVALSAALFYVALRAVSSAERPSGATGLDSLAAGLIQRRRSRVMVYLLTSRCRA